ncbi:TetR family transcriptional regulator [Acuticoccus sp. MNP-M23]|uniref:TetR/AcrR family transcriptional regulator n=1 Tax=Acuticoccus sp. MNP-M23 TaxID=3072793 RepID=UPI002815E921|nr:TetR family transcriptional regulator [Acuticoccus sp. MNP-M23]WMS43176.1 TetR family transcriptional regulator [Acuticoccus sp. MNP-M23]
MPAHRKRPRNAEATRAAIEQSARHHFEASGYDAVGLREIARDAGVDAALISRYYGSKKGLFEAAILPHFNIDALLQGDMTDFGARVARMMLDPGHKQGFDPNRALLNSVGSPEVGSQINEALTGKVVDVLASRIGGAQTRLRAALVIAILTGVDTIYRIARLDALANADQAALGELLSASIQGLVDDREDD